MGAKQGISVLTDTQKSLALEYLGDRIIPCITSIVESCKTPEAKEVLMTLILVATRSTIVRQESDAFVDKLNTLTINIRNLLKSLFRLYQEENERHIFIASIIDERYGSNSGEVKAWKADCKREVLGIYSARIHEALKRFDSALYRDICASLDLEDSHQDVSEVPEKSENPFQI